MHGPADDLFSETSDGMQPIPLPDADIRFQTHFYSATDAQSIFLSLQAETDWRNEQIVLFGKRHWQPRLVAAHGDIDYRYSGLTLPALPWTPLLARLRNDVIDATGLPFNHVLLNYYRDQHDSMGWHSDDEAALGPNPAVASLSFGASRIFKLRHARRAELKSLSLLLGSGSLLLMAGATQHNWKHAVEKSRTESGPRINLTFRRIIPLGNH